MNTSANLSGSSDLLKIVTPLQPGGRTASVLRAAVGRLRERIISSPSGHFLGFENELVEWLGVSRPTFRQVARLLEYEQFLAIKKGPGGGFFCRRPSADAVVHLASVSLVAKEGRLIHMSQASKPLYREVARLAAAQGDAQARQELLCYVQASGDQGALDNISEFVRLTEDFTGMLITLAANPVLEMFVGIVHEFASELRAHKGITKDDRRDCLCVIDMLARAVVDGDIEVAGLMADRLSEHLHRWQYENSEPS